MAVVLPPALKLRQKLFDACKNGELANVRALILADSTTLQLVDEQGTQPFHIAAAAGHIEIVRLLLDKGVDIDVQTQYGWTPLMHACSHGHDAIVQLLLQFGARADLVNVLGCGAIHCACQAGSLPLVERLLVNSNWSDGSYTVSPLSTAIATGHTELLQLLLEHGLDPNQSASQTRWTPLMLAVHTSQELMCELLLAHGASLSPRNARGHGVIEIAQHAPSAIRSLLSQAAVADPLQRSGTAFSAPLLELTNAIRIGDLDVCRSIIQRSPLCINQRSDSGQTGLMLAAGRGDVAITRLLLENGADPHIVSKTEEWTPLLFSIYHNQIDVARTLIAVLASQGFRENEFETALAMAQHLQRPTISAELETVRLQTPVVADPSAQPAIHTLPPSLPTAPFQVQAAPIRRRTKSTSLWRRVSKIFTRRRSSTSIAIPAAPQSPLDMNGRGVFDNAFPSSTAASRGLSPSYDGSSAASNPPPNIVSESKYAAPSHPHPSTPPSPDPASLPTTRSSVHLPPVATPQRGFSRIQVAPRSTSPLSPNQRRGSDSSDTIAARHLVDAHDTAATAAARRGSSPLLTSSPSSPKSERLSPTSSALAELRSDSTTSVNRGLSPSTPPSPGRAFRFPRVSTHDQPESDRVRSPVGTGSAHGRDKVVRRSLHRTSSFSSATSHDRHVSPATHAARAKARLEKRRRHMSDPQHTHTHLMQQAPMNFNTKQDIDGRDAATSSPSLSLSSNSLRALMLSAAKSRTQSTESTTAPTTTPSTPPPAPSQLRRSGSLSARAGMPRPSSLSLLQDSMRSSRTQPSTKQPARTHTSPTPLHSSPVRHRSVSKERTRVPPQNTQTQDVPRALKTATSVSQYLDNTTELDEALRAVQEQEQVMTQALDKVRRIFEARDLGQYWGKLQAEEIDMMVFVTLEDQDLAELGVDDPDARRSILEIVQTQNQAINVADYLQTSMAVFAQQATSHNQTKSKQSSNHSTGTKSPSIPTVPRLSSPTAPTNLRDTSTRTSHSQPTHKLVITPIDQQPTVQHPRRKLPQVPPTSLTKTTKAPLPGTLSRASKA
eukprot:m.114564 g.114564  ORF g.114564 m.114564 type:complete len:1061 (-) comp13543_c0_seq4:1459-4641(-)